MKERQTSFCWDCDFYHRFDALLRAIMKPVFVNLLNTGLLARPYHKIVACCPVPQTFTSYLIHPHWSAQHAGRHSAGGAGLWHAGGHQADHLWGGLPCDPEVRRPPLQHLWRDRQRCAAPPPDSRPAIIHKLPRLISTDVSRKPLCFRYLIF